MSDELRHYVIKAIKECGLDVSYVAADMAARAAIEAVRAFDARRAPGAAPQFRNAPGGVGITVAPVDEFGRPWHPKKVVEAAQSIDADQIEADGHAKLRAIAEVDRVARAMRESEGASGEWDDLSTTSRSHYRGKAKYFLAALRVMLPAITGNTDLRPSQALRQLPRGPAADMFDMLHRVAAARSVLSVEDMRKTANIIADMILTISDADAALTRAGRGDLCRPFDKWLRG